MNILNHLNNAIFLFLITIFNFSLFAENVKFDQQTGKLIVAMGLPGSGKSSVFQALAEDIGAELFSEPEEGAWPDAVMNRDLSGNFSMLCWFRSIRVPLLFQADLVRKKGAIAFADSYYDKLLFYYLGKPGMEWLCPSSDPYYHVIREMAAVDWRLLPNADIIVFFDLDLSTWKSFIKQRNRKLDCDESFLLSYHTQDLFWDAVQQLAHEMSIKVIRFTQIKESPYHAALRLKNILIKEGILNDDAQKVCPSSSTSCQ